MSQFMFILAVHCIMPTYQKKIIMYPFMHSVPYWENGNITKQDI